MTSTTNSTSSGAANAIPHGITELALYLDITDVAALNRLILDGEVYNAFSGLLRKGLYEHDLTLVAAWQLARRYFLVGSKNDSLVDYDRDSGHAAGEFTSAMAIATHFEMVEARRKEMGIEAWGSQSQNWRVCYLCFEYFINSDDMYVFDEDREKLEFIQRAVEWNTLDMCAPGEYVANEVSGTTEPRTSQRRGGA